MSSDDEHNPYSGLNDRRAESKVDHEAWHMSRSVPLALVITLIVQTAVLASWAAAFKSEFTSHQTMSVRQFDDIRKYIDARTQGRITNSEVMAELRNRDLRLSNIEKHDEEMLDEVRRIQSTIARKLERIEGKLDKHDEARNHGFSLNNGNGFPKALEGYTQ